MPEEYESDESQENLEDQEGQEGLEPREKSQIDGDNVYYSPFWPLTIVLAALIIWLSYQVYCLNESRSALSTQLDQMAPALQQANAAQNRLVSLIKDILETSSKDAYAKQVLNEAVQAGLLRLNSTPASESSSNTSGSSDVLVK